MNGDGALLMPSEAAALLRVHPRTLARWADGGYVVCIRTLGGHRRYRYGDIARVLGERGLGSVRG